jgi:putative membrane-bound dehydrogenase-like protein
MRAWLILLIVAVSDSACKAEHGTDQGFPWRVGSASVEMDAEDSMVIGGGIGPGYVQGQEGKLQATATFIQGEIAVCIVAVDVLMMHRDTMDLATEQISQVCQLPIERIMINASHTHHAPSTVTIHGYERDEEFCARSVDAIVAAARLARLRADRAEACRGFFHLGREESVGQNSRLLLDDGQIYWIGSRDTAVGPTDPFDPDLPVVAFRSANDQLHAALFNHSTHCIGTRTGRRSPGFYGLAAQELADQHAAPITFLSGAAGSTHNLTLDCQEMVQRIKTAFNETLDQAIPMRSSALAALRREVPFSVRVFDERAEDEKVVKYCRKYAAAHADSIIDVFRESRRQLKIQQGNQRTMWLQVLQVGDVYLVGIPAEFFTVLGLEIKRRSPFPNTFICGLSNDYVGYLPTREGFEKGGYQTWMGLHSFAQIGTGEMVVEQCLEMLNELADASESPATTTSESPATSASEPHIDSNFRAGAAAVEITPTELPRIIAGGFLEGRGDKVQDPLFVRSVVLDDGQSNLALTIVDTCMMPRSLIDEAKRLAMEQCGIPTDRIMVSATHTHSAPAAMGCLGTRMDDAYAEWLPAKIAESIVTAFQRRQPARVGWASVDDWQHTHNRRWIRHPDRLVVDPFGNATGRAHMHPGHESPDVIGPSGPVDPELWLLSLQALDGTPLAVIANYGQHYYGAPAISADYFGKFAKFISDFLGQPGEGNGPFICAMSQGTSGDLAPMDYGAPAKPRDIDRYAQAVARFAEQALQTIEYRDHAELDVVEQRLQLRYRVADPERLEWARPIAAQIKEDVPKSLPEVYAREAIILTERQETEIQLQAIRIGELTIAAIPNEVYALTGLKLKAQAPTTQHFNIELANGAEGYIPPPEQHQLGGYTTWPARTAGLESEAEPKIVDALLSALERITGKARRPMRDTHGIYARAVLGLSPIDYWRLNDADGVEARNAIPGRPSATITPGYAWYLPGVGSGSGSGEEAELSVSAFSGPTQINRAVHLAGGMLEAESSRLTADFSISLWFWLGHRSGARQRVGQLVTLPDGLALKANQFEDHLAALAMDGLETGPIFQADQWNFVVLVRKADQLSVFANGADEPVLVLQSQPNPIEDSSISKLQFGAQLLGKLDEIAVWDRALTCDEIQRLWTLSEVPAERKRPETEFQPGLGQRSRRSQTPSLTSDDSVMLKGMKPTSFNGTQPNTDLTRAPLTPRESLNSIHVPEGYRVHLVASEPEVLDPVAFDWDEFGRLWVVEMADYPLGMDGAGKAGGRIRRLEDLDGDGTFERSTLFADELSFPTGILTWGTGVIVTAAPEILYLQDTTGDGRADRREVWFSGFNEGNQQLRVNGLRWGLDGWVYCANGGHHAGYGTETQAVSHRNGHRLKIGSRDFRFHPETGEIQLESGPSQFGRNRNAWGHWFGTQNANPLWQYVIAERYLDRNPYVPTPSPIRHVAGAGSPPVFPASPAEKRYHSFEQSGRFTSACSGMIYGDESLFQPSDEGHSFVCEPFHNLVQHQILMDAGPSYIARRSPTEQRHDFFASQDRWCRPVMVRTGPDGALWVADMYRYMIEHPDWLPQEGREELLPHYRLGETHGRIYRVVREDAVHRAIPALDRLNGHELVQALDSPNDWQRDKVQQLLSKEKDPGIIPFVIHVAKMGHHPQARLQALYLLQSLAALPDNLLISALNDSHPRVREGAIRLSEGTGNSQLIQAAVALRNDPDEKVRFQLALSCGQWSDRSAGQALASIATQDFRDPLTVAAVMSSAVPHFDVLLSEILRGQREGVDAFREPMLRQSLSSNNAEAISRMLEETLQGSFAEQCLRLADFIATLHRLNLTLERLLDDHPNQRLIAQVEKAQQCLESARTHLKASETGSESRLPSAILLARLVEDRHLAVVVLGEFLQPHRDAQQQAEVIRHLAASASENVPEILAQTWQGLSPKLRSQAVDTWLSRSEWTVDLLKRIEQGEILKSGLELAQQSRLLQHPSPNVAEQAAALFGRSAKPSEVLQRYRTVLEIEGDAERGRAVYVESCASCHRRGDLGVDVGPNLATVLGHTRDKLLANILDPNADIQPGYQSITCLLETGELLTGLISSESAHSLTITLTNGSSRTIMRSEIEQLKNTGISLMPEGLEEKISPEAMADLLAYLQSPLTNEGE